MERVPILSNKFRKAFRTFSHSPAGRAVKDDLTVSLASPLESTRREQAKAERRARIVAAAYDLLREVGREALSMKMVAARADVAVSTLYKLFGSKQAILSTVFDQDLERFKDRLTQLASVDAIARMMDTVDFATEIYRADPKLQRALLWRAPSQEVDAGLDAALREPRILFWRSLVRAAIDEGQLRPSTDASALATLLIHIFSGAIEDWMANAISLDQLRAETQYGFAVALSVFASSPIAPSLRERVKTLQRSLAAFA
jgi:AcrR family transcriptional regulator